MSYINYGFINYSAPKLAELANRVIQNMSADARFDSLKPDVDSVKALYDDFQAVLGLSTFNRSSEALTTAQSALSSKMRILGLKVEVEAGDNIQLVIASGFPVRQERKAPLKNANLLLSKPLGVNVFKKEGDPVGMVRLKWEAVEGAVNYGVEYQVKGSDEIKNGTYNTRLGAIITDLTPGLQIDFYVYAIGRNGKKSEKSSPVSIWVS